MKQIFLFFLIAFCFSFKLKAQDEITWLTRFDEANKLVIIDAKILPGWHLYGVHLDENLGPIPTRFNFSPSKSYNLNGELKSSKELVVYDVNFGVDLPIFEKEAHFTQAISLNQDSDLQIEVTYMLCNDERCLPPTTKTLALKVKK